MTNDSYILLNYYNNLDFLLDRFITFIVIFLLLMVGATTRNIVLNRCLNRKQIIIASLFNAIVFSFLSMKLINIFGNFFFPLVLVSGLIQKEFIKGLMNSKLIKKFQNFINSGGDKN